MSKFVVALALCCCTSLLAAETPARARFANLPLSFEPNQGQTDARVRYLSRGPGYTLFLTSTEIVLATRQDSRGPVRLRLVNGNSEAHVEALEPLPGVSNYFLGNDPTKWRTNIPTYKRVALREVYPGIDAVFYGNQRQLEYDLVVAPGANPNLIRMKFEGASGFRAAGNGDLILLSGPEEVRLRKPSVYQIIDGRRREISGRYAIRAGNEVAFEVARYDRARALVIDPVVGYSTYLGGNGDDRGHGIAIDSSGNAYIVGETSSTNFPTAGPIQAARGGTGNDIDAFVTKLNAAGSAIVYSTYLGGSAPDLGQSIAVDSSGNAYVAGITISSNFPVLHAIQGVAGGGQDAWAAKLNAAGNALVYSTYLGGGGADGAFGMAIDSSGNAYVTGFAASGFPTASPLQGTFGGGISDAFVAKINAAGTALVYSTFIGGTGDDSAYAIAVDSGGNAYITGSTSGSFPTAAAVQPTFGGSQDAFVTKVNAAGTALVYSTFLGGTQVDGGRGIAVDAGGNAYITGFTTGSFPIANAQQNTFGGAQDAFLTKLNAAGSAMLYSTYLGGSGFDVGYSIAVDSSGSAYVGGGTSSPNFPLASALQSTATGAFLTKYNPAGAGLLFSTYLGGTASDTVFGTAVDASGNVYLTGITGGSLPLTNALQGTFGGGQFDAFVELITGTGLAPAMTLGHSTLNFGVAGSLITSPQTVTVSFAGGAAVSWTATSNQPNVTVSPASGTGNGAFQVTAAAGSNAVVTVTAPGASNSPQQVTVNVTTVNETAPFGSFDTPPNNTSGIAGAVGVTGWALDNVQVTGVTIWREPVPGETPSSNGLVFIGNANFVAGARPDVEGSFPNFPLNYRAGWGYMLLTNSLPNNNGGTGGIGNGTYKLHALAVNKGGTTTDLGTHTITVDNADATKPFGTIDTPDQGGSASGTQFINFGWALTQNPKCIPTDGSTITVILDGVPQGHPVYNQPRNDIATQFPGRCNTPGPVGYFFIDTTKLANGVHTISWNVFDNGGQGDGIGSRYFTVSNTSVSAGPEEPPPATAVSDGIKVRRGFSPNSRTQWLHSGETVEMQELGYLQLDTGAASGYLVVNGERRPLPVGSTLRGGVFYWNPGPGFLGDFPMVFERPDGTTVDVVVRIGMKAYNQEDQ